VTGAIARARAPAWLRLIRPHQWAKNALILLPALAAHLPWTAALVLRLGLGFLALSFAASALYAVNDIVDLPNDRLHPTKLRRPLPAGEIGIGAAALLAVGLAILGLVCALALPPLYGATLACYAILSGTYSLLLKRKPILDAIALTTLYAARLVAGAVLAPAPLSRWFLAFSVFFFLSLALVKRVVELSEREAPGGGALAGRGYVREDLLVLAALGVASSAVDALVYCLYITSPDVTRLYGTPDLLWIGLPILLYWQARVWLLTVRGDMHDDPVVFTLKDLVSWLLLGGFLLTVLMAA
jgi:4-hydroxybenzoate polyprenyltransferase